MRIQHALFLLVAACTNTVAQHDHDIKLPPTPPGTPTGGTVPSGGFAFGQGAFHFIGSTVPGNADFVDAPLSDPNMQPPTLGTGDYNVTLDGTAYANTLSSESIIFDDGTGNPYLVVGGYYLYTGTDSQQHVDQVVVIVKQ